MRHAPTARCLVGLLSAFALLAAGCQSENRADQPADTAPVAAAAPVSQPVNQKCPFSGGNANPTIAADYKGETIAFCCPGCKNRWAKMNDADRDRLLADVR